MREDFKVLGGLLAAFQSANTLALPPTSPGSADVTFQVKAAEAAAGFMLRQFVGTGEQINKIKVFNGNYAVAGVTGSTGFISMVDVNGNPVTSFGNGGTVSYPGLNLRALDFYRNRVVGAGSLGKNAALLILDARTGAPIPGCGDASGRLFFPPPSRDSMIFTDLIPWTGDDFGAVAVLANVSENDFESGLYIQNSTSCTDETSFGNNGHAFAQGDFYASWGVRTANGALIGGITQPAGSAFLSAGVFNIDINGNPGSCGSAVKPIFSVTGQHVYSNAGYFDPASGLVNFVGYSTPNNFLMRQLQSDCTLNSVTYSYPNPGIPTALINVTTESMVVAVNEPVVPQQYADRVALYGMNGGAPLALSPIVNKRAAAPDAREASGAGDRGAKAIIAHSSLGLSVATQPDAKILVGGTSNANGGSSLIARYIGVEVTSNVVEFYNSILVHYFITADANEAAAIDGGSAGPGWSRTQQTWKSGGPDRVCRFYGNQAFGGPNGHFYTIETAECAAVKLDPGWHFESYDFSGWPTSAGSCPAGTIAVKRVYNGRFAQHDSNHRYTISDTIYNQMVTMGWTPEGIVFCSVL